MLEKKITGVGTIMSNRKSIPKDLKTPANREANSYKFFWESVKAKITLHSYVVQTKSKGMKNVLVLSSMPPLLGTTTDDGHVKPAVLKFYDFSKGGTDIVDQRIGKYTTNTKSRRWSMAAFSYILDTARVNSQTIYSMNNNIHPRISNSFEYGWQLVQEFIGPHVIDRKQNLSKTLHKSVMNKIDYILSEMNYVDSAPIIQPSPISQYSETKKRCYACVEAITPTEYKKKYDNLSKVKAQCHKCSKQICKLHTVFTCHQCL